MTCGRGNECAQCGEHFGSIQNFDRHQTVRGGSLDYEVICASVEEIASWGLERGRFGLWGDPVASRAVRAAFAKVEAGNGIGEETP
jgi:hypothetical protein